MGKFIEYLLMYLLFFDLSFEYSFDGVVLFSLFNFLN